MASGVLQLGSTVGGGGGGSGTVTSVDVAVPAFLLSAGGPITTAGTITLSLSGTALPVANGGTGLTSGTSGGILAYSASGTLVSSGALTASQLIIGGGAGVAPSTLAAGSQYQVLRMGAANPAYGSINLDQAAAVTGVLPNGNTTAASANTASTIVARDGSGNFTAGTITATLTGTASGNTTYSANNHGIVISGSGNAMTVIAPDASTTKVLTSGGASADPSWQVVPAFAPAWVNYTPIFTGFGTVTVQSFYYLTIGKVTFIYGRFTSGISTAVEGRVSIPVTSSANIVTILGCGNWTGDGLGTINATPVVLIEASKAYVCFGIQGTATSSNAETKQNGNGFVSSGAHVSFTAMIPID